MKNRLASKAISQVAREHHVAEDTVREDMKSAISEALRSPDPAVQALWKQIPCAGETPEPEELIAWIIKKIQY